MSKLDEFFSHENQGSPPSLSDCGRITSGTKCDLIHCMDKLGCSVESPKPTVLIPDGAVCVQMLKPQFCKTSQEYSEKVFLPYIAKSLENVQRVDLVWDEYIPNSLKHVRGRKEGLVQEGEFSHLSQYPEIRKTSYVQMTTRRNCSHSCRSRS